MLRWLKHLWWVWRVAWVLMRVAPAHVEPGAPEERPVMVPMAALPGLVRWTLWAGVQAQLYCMLLSERVEEPN